MWQEPGTNDIGNLTLLKLLASQSLLEASQPVSLIQSSISKLSSSIEARV